MAKAMKMNRRQPCTLEKTPIPATRIEARGWQSLADLVAKDQIEIAPAIPQE